MVWLSTSLPVTCRHSTGPWEVVIQQKGASSILDDSKGAWHMEREYTALNPHFLKAGSNFVRPTQELPEKVKLTDPAMNVMTDLRSVSVVTVRAKTPMDKAHAKMVRYGVRTLLVLDEAD